LHFQKEQILLLDSHDLFQAPTQTLHRVLDFVGLPAFTPDVDRALAKGQNKGADCGNHEDLYALAQVSVSCVCGAGFLKGQGGFAKCYRFSRPRF